MSSVVFTTFSIENPESFVPSILGLGVDLFELYRSCRENKISEFREMLCNGIKKLMAESSPEISKLDESYRETLLADHGSLEAIITRLENEDNKKEIERHLKRFNEQHSFFREKIELLKIEQKEKEEEISRFIKQTEENIRSLENRDIGESLTSELASLSQCKNLSDKLTGLEHIKSKLHNFSISWGLTTLFDAQSIEEEKYISSEERERIQLISEIRKFSESAKALDNIVHQDWKPLIQDIERETHKERLTLVKDEIKLKYGRLKKDIAKTSLYRRTIQELLNNIVRHEGHERLKNLMISMLDMRIINTDDYNRLLEDTYLFIRKATEEAERRETILEIKCNLESMGYSVVERDRDFLSALDNGEILHLDTEWEGYRILVKLDENKGLTTRLVRMVATEEEKENISAYEKQRDIETGRKWCQKYDIFIERMVNNGVIANIEMRKEPSEEDIMYMVDTGKAALKESDTKKIMADDKHKTQ